MRRGNNAGLPRPLEELPAATRTGSRFPRRARPPRGGTRAAVLQRTCVALCAGVLFCASNALAERPRKAAEREHTVSDGQTLSSIASRYGVSVAAIVGANSLGSESKLKLGQVLVIPEPGVVYVRPGDTLGAIAQRNRISSAELMRSNGLKADAKLRIGQALVLPGFERVAAARGTRSRWGVPKQRGVVTLLRIATRERRRIRLIDSRGRVAPGALRELKDLFRPRGARVGKSPDPRLVQLLARVSDYFGGREIQVISGYRRPGGYTRTTSRHVAAEALDFRIEGVPLEELRDYCAKLGRVGVGFYPIGQFVHLDVRKTSAHWTDWSGPGEAPLLVQPLPTPEGAEESATAQAALDEQPNATSAAPPPESTAANTHLYQPPFGHQPPAGAGLIPR